MVPRCVGIGAQRDQEMRRIIQRRRAEPVGIGAVERQQIRLIDLLGLHSHIKKLPDQRLSSGFQLPGQGFLRFDRDAFGADHLTIDDHVCK